MNGAKKYLFVIKIKPEHQEDYIGLHKDPYPEMLRAIKDAGFTKEVLFFFEGQSIVYVECGGGMSYEECDRRLREQDICKKWDAAVGPWFEAQPVLCEKIFDLEQQLEGGLLRD